MRLRRALALCLPCLLLLSSAAAAMEAWQMADNLPRRYTGAFAWRDAPDQVQHLVLIFKRVKTTEQGKVEMEGQMIYRTDRVTHIEITAQADPRTLEIEIFEASPVGQQWASDGSHRGKFSPDLKAITAVWTTRTTGRQGDLRLHSSTASVRPDAPKSQGR